MSTLGNLGGAVGGGVADFFGLGDDDREKAQQALAGAAKGYSTINPNITASTVGPSALPAAGAGARGAQVDALTALRRKYSQGGLDALTRANLSQVEQENANAGRTAAAGAQDAADRRGVGAGGNAIVNAQVAGQQAANRNAAQALQVAGIGEANKTAAAAGAGQLAGETRGQDYQAASAQDAIDRFNAGQKQGAQQLTVGNQLARAGGAAGVAGQQYTADMANADRWKNDLAGIGQAGGTVAGYFAPPGMQG